MSFSQNVKGELARQLPSAKHCMYAEIQAIILFSGQVVIHRGDKYSLNIYTENLYVARKYFTLLEKAFNIKAEIAIRQNIRQNAYFKNSRTYTITVNDHESVIKLLKREKLMDDEGIITRVISVADDGIMSRNCCKRAFLRGVFLSAGSLTEPEKSYHFELVCSEKETAEQLCEVIKCFEIDAKIVERKRYFVVYIKEGESIVDMLNIMEAHQSLMELENIRILKEMRNTVNRKVNCETANLNKTVSAAIKQIEDITFIEKNIGLSSLSKNLRDMAVVRLENPDASLKELGALMNPPVGKSGVNHRLRKLSEIAEEARQ